LERLENKVSLALSKTKEDIWTDIVVRDGIVHGDECRLRRHKRRRGVHRPVTV